MHIHIHLKHKLTYRVFRIQILNRTYRDEMEQTDQITNES